MESKSTAELLHQFLIENQLTLSFAESCTGGALSAYFVQMPDCSRYFLGSIVSYSGKAKEKLLGVHHETLQSFGEVSPQTAIEMALGALHQFDTDFALAITGIAGPSGGSDTKPVGTVYIALVSRAKPPFCSRHHFSGARKEIIDQSTECALTHLRDYIL